MCHYYNKTIIYRLGYLIVKKLKSHKAIKLLALVVAFMRPIS
jgi:hypothetical protein